MCDSMQVMIDSWPTGTVDGQGRKGAGKKKKGSSGDGEMEKGGSLDWGAEFGHLVQILHQLLLLDLAQLWDPPSVTVMEDFTKLVEVPSPSLCPHTYGLPHTTIHMVSHIWSPTYNHTYGLPHMVSHIQPYIWSPTYTHTYGLPHTHTYGLPIYTHTYGLPIYTHTYGTLIQHITICMYAFTCAQLTHAHVSLVANVCYKLCEVPAFVKDKALRTDLFLVLGIVGKKYCQSLSKSGPLLHIAALW